jgi:hypothetical protein
VDPLGDVLTPVGVGEEPVWVAVHWVQLQGLLFFSALARACRDRAADLLEGFPVDLAMVAFLTVAFLT